MVKSLERTSDSFGIIILADDEIRCWDKNAKHIRV